MRVCIFTLLLIFSENILANSEEGRYLLYDCNPGEGFNLRRDVFIRIVNLVKYLNTKEKWTLVLPPWGGIGYHWKERNMEQSKIPWSKFFDVGSLNEHVNVMEYEDYVEKIGEAAIDEIWYLQTYAEGIDFNNWVDKTDERPCIEPPVYESDDNGKIRGWFWGYEETYAKKFKCVSALGNARILSEPLLGKNTTAKSVMIDRGENVLHDTYGGKDYWDARRSMVFSRELRNFAADFRKKFLDSDDEKDKTKLPDNWKDNKREDNSAVGGPYIAAHVRRKDFLRARKEHVPSIKKVAEKLSSVMKEYKVDKIFIASDGTEKEMTELEKLLPNMVRYIPTSEEDKKYKKGGIAIIDQIICSHARYFIGSYESTFTFRITEEREIMGFSKETTYNRFCGDDEKDCQQLTKWRISWNSDKEIWQ
ncbi:GDP-fucose protein O-fucosyltransferase 2-like [Styela clava]